MEFTQYKCPVCNKQFESGDDIVVCPECGAPHHRECYELNGKCFFEEKHSEDFSFEEYIALNGNETADGKNVCPVCRFENVPGAFFCNRCGSPLNEKQQSNNQYQNPNQRNPFGYGQYGQNQGYQNQQQSQNTQTPPPYGFGAAGIPNFDPLAGMDAEEDLGDGIKVGEMAKFVGKNTNYFLLICDRIRKFGRAKFNFAAFLLSGIYFLYRKMYFIGVLFSLVIIGLNLLSTYIKLTPEYTEAYNQIYQLAGSASGASGYQLITMMDKVALLYAPELLTFVRYGLMVFSGLLANRLYINHCRKSIIKIKKDNEGGEINEKLSSKGGVNLAIALSFGISTIVIAFICEFILLTSI